ncbi:diacylglycerol/polyprenol kinase family protein, partial [Magnetococcales bacterium HHB-1]
LSSALIPILYWQFFDRDFMLRGVIFLAAGFLLAEYLRLNFAWARTLFMRVFGPAIRKHENLNLTGATYVFTGAVLTIFLFPKELAVPALLILSISDTFAAIIGIPFGRHRFLQKSVEGSISFLICTLIILFIFFPENHVANILIAVLVTLAEAYPVKVDDNFIIPLLSGVLLLIATSL